MKGPYTESVQPKQALRRLGTATGDTHADQARSLGILVGDTIVGIETYGDHTWSEAKLTLLWIGERVCVWDQSRRSSHNPDIWISEGECPNWTLNSRDWKATD